MSYLTKDELIRLIREDREFRAKIIEALLEVFPTYEHFNRIMKKLEEHDRKFNSILSEIKTIWQKIEELTRRMDELSRRVDGLSKRVDDLSGRVDEQSERINKLSAGQSMLGVQIGALAESIYARFLWEDIREEIEMSGKRVLRRARNIRIDDKEVDLLVETDDSVYVVEIKVQPEHEDVNSLLVKSDLAARLYAGKKVIPVLAGTLIGREVVSYAESRGVKVYVY